ncbi:ABC transporter ATP-binding protein [Gordonia sp. ABSL1-1]|uniref:ABC transporter ATP-binding protein n=1 Tax=Gordonia sp. ABSL1-1 TaxID=3053923 RepID=UPI002572A868|nr:ABC transporter ATP-binding protein [Gordonia sp. ABSL1-1]MDL9937842.1 ABC transporter ATP-binding protein [Gordonia sp. ABSL1-1]
MTNVLDCRALDAGYRKNSPCVRGVDLSLRTGEILALVGPNGAGKTTLLNTVAGLLPALGGGVAVGGSPLPAGNPRAAVRAGVVLVPDDRALFGRLSVTQNLALAVRARGDRKEQVERVLDHFPSLRKRLKVDAGQLSGGEQQMLAIGRALVQRPKALLIDELSMGLAPVIVESILPVLREVAATDGTAIVIVEQHVRLALDVADRAMVLVHGQVRLDEDASTLARDVGRIEHAYLGADDIAS